MAACCCRKGLRDVSYSHDETRLNSVKAFLQNLLSNNVNSLNCSDLLRSYILNLLEEVNRHDYSLCKFLEVLYNTRHGDFSALERERKKGEVYKKKGVDKENSGTKKKKMTQTQIACMLRKRKRRMEMNVIKLCMFPGNFPKLVGESEMKDLVDNSSCFVEAHNQLNNDSFQNNKNVTFVKVWATPGENISSLRESLQNKASALQEELDRQRRLRVSTRSKRRPAWFRCHDSYIPGEYISYVDNIKEIMHDDFDKKCLKAKNSKNTNHKNTTSVLSKGHCLHCHKEFTSLKDKSTCKHHSGFIVDNAWSCCDVPVQSGRLTDHQDTGCVEAKTHVWRVHARSDHKERKAGANNPIYTA